jgi:hypothetical protein
MNLTHFILRDNLCLLKNTKSTPPKDEWILDRRKATKFELPDGKLEVKKHDGAILLENYPDSPILRKLRAQRRIFADRRDALRSVIITNSGRLMAYSPNTLHFRRLKKNLEERTALFKGYEAQAKEAAEQFEIEQRIDLEIVTNCRKAMPGQMHARFRVPTPCYSYTTYGAEEKYSCRSFIWQDAKEEWHYEGENCEINVGRVPIGTAFEQVTKLDPIHGDTGLVLKDKVHSVTVKIHSENLGFAQNLEVLWARSLLDQINSEWSQLRKRERLDIEEAHREITGLYRELARALPTAGKAPDDVALWSSAHLFTVLVKTREYATKTKPKS